VHGLLVFEDHQSVPRVRLFRALGVDWTLTPRGWLVVPAFIPLGVIPGLLFYEGTFAERLSVGATAGLVVVASLLLHELGHVISARLAGGPMREILIAAVRPLTLYHDLAEPPGRVHIGRAIGGPAMNLAVGVSLLSLWGVGFVPAFAALFNVALGLVSLLPIPSVDGEVIWREVRRN
jgi:Zn-dependent protease